MYTNYQVTLMIKRENRITVHDSTYIMYFELR